MVPQTENAALSINEATKLLNVGRTTLYRLISDGQLPARKLGRRTLILRGDVDELLRSLPTTVDVGKDSPV